MVDVLGRPWTSGFIDSNPTEATLSSQVALNDPASDNALVDARQILAFDGIRC